MAKLHNNTDKPLYLFRLEDNELNRYVITDYSEKVVSEYTGRIEYRFRGVPGKNDHSRHSVKKEWIDKYRHRSVYTFEDDIDRVASIIEYELAAKLVEVEVKRTSIADQHDMLHRALENR